MHCNFLSLLLVAATVLVVTPAVADVAIGVVTVIMVLMEIAVADRVIWDGIKTTEFVIVIIKLKRVILTCW